MKEVVIVNYDTGNICSIERAVAVCGAKPVFSSTAEGIDSAEMLILPGVGAFGKCISALHEKNLAGSLKKYAMSGKPMLGICVGMQMLFDGSHEFGHHEGLGLISGEVSQIPNHDENGKARRIPHVSWEELDIQHRVNDTIFEGVFHRDSCYFAHSYVAHPSDFKNVLATCSYDGLQLCVAVQKVNIYGVQFHPEKSGSVGLKILSNFIALTSNP